MCRQMIHVQKKPWPCAAYLPLCAAGHVSGSVSCFVDEQTHGFGERNERGSAVCSVCSVYPVYSVYFAFSARLWLPGRPCTPPTCTRRHFNLRRSDFGDQVNETGADDLALYFFLPHFALHTRVECITHLYAHNQLLLRKFRAVSGLFQSCFGDVRGHAYCSAPAPDPSPLLSLFC